MKKLLFLSIFSLGFAFLKAQETGRTSKWGVSFTPAIILTPNAGYGIQPGVVYQINDRFSLLTDFTIASRKNQHASVSNNKYFRIKPELRYSNGSSRFEKYLGLQLSYAYRKWDDLNGGCYFNNKFNEDTANKYSKATIHSPIFTSSIQTGAILKITNRFYLDAFMGMGIRMIFTSYDDIENPGKDIYFKARCKIFPSPDPAHWVNGDVSRFHANAGIRVIYRF